MNRTIANANTFLAERVTSIDFFRGFTMFILIIENTHIIRLFRDVENSGFLEFIATQFSHQRWEGLHFWDLVQPAFMFIVGVAIPFAVANRRRKGDSDARILRHAVKRSLILLFLGWWLYCIGPEEIVYRFQNVLAQLSVTYLVAFLIMKRSFRFQLIFSLGILLFIDLAYRFFPVAGFTNPWVDGENLGAWFNILLQPETNGSGWATLNFISTTAHTIWGVLCGQLLMSDKPVARKIKLLVIAGLAALAVGWALHLAGLTPIIKKIATSSFVFASGGYVILALALSYWLMDVKKLLPRFSKAFIIVGMNCIFIYMFNALGGSGILHRIFTPFTNSVLSPLTGEFYSALIQGVAVYFSLWYICYWMYKKRLFIKI